MTHLIFLYKILEGINFIEAYIWYSQGDYLIKILKYRNIMFNILSEYFLNEWYKNYIIYPFANKSENFIRVFESWFLKDKKFTWNT